MDLSSVSLASLLRSSLETIGEYDDRVSQRMSMKQVISILVSHAHTHTERIVIVVQQQTQRYLLDPEAIYQLS